MSIRRSSLICVAYLQVYERVADNRWWPNIGGLLYLSPARPAKSYLWSSSQLYRLILTRSKTTMSRKEDQHEPLANNESDAAGKTD